jgi:hypothetical protein
MAGIDIAAAALNWRRVARRLVGREATVAAPRLAP